MSDWPPPSGSGQPPPPPPNWGTPTGSGSGGSSPLGGSPPPPGGSPPPPAWGDQQPGWGGQQQPGWPGQQPQPWQQQPAAGGGTNGAAIAALIVGILALLGGIIPFIGVVAGILLGLIALVLGIVGLRKARAPGVGTGRGMAITGIVLGILGLLFGIGQIVALIAGFSAFEDSGVFDDLREQIEQQGSATSVFDLAEGDCYDDPADSDAVARVPSVTCSQPHDNEVFAIIDYPAEGSDYPGLSEVTEYASEQCQGDLFSDFVGTDYLDSRYYVTTLYPTEETWAEGDREVVCALYDQDGQITGSVAGSEE